MKKMKCLCGYGMSRPDIGLLIIRVCVAAVFIFEGIQKLTNISMAGMAFQQMGFAPMWAWIDGIVELVAGILIGVGLFTWIAAGLLAIVMLVAVWVMIRLGGPMAAIQPFAFLFSAVALAFSGAGRYSLDARCKCRMNGGMAGDCACCGDSSKCTCDSNCENCDCGK